MGNPVVHFQICAEDVDAMSALYREVFGTYPIIEAEESGIAGGITDLITAKGGAVLVIEVDDVQATIERVERLGGYRRFPGTPPEPVALAGGDGAGVSFDWQEFEDQEGNLVGLIQR